MKLVLILFLSFCTFHCFSQKKQTPPTNSILYVIDNVAYLDPPQSYLSQINKDDIDHSSETTGKIIIDKLHIHWNNSHGDQNPNIDKVITIITKEFANRPDSIRRIESMKSLHNQDNLYYREDPNMPYTGHYIDYYMNGKKQREGEIKNGKEDGLTTLYHQNGYKVSTKTYVNGVIDGICQDFYSTGKLKFAVYYVNNKPHFNEEQDSFFKLLNRSWLFIGDGSYRAALKDADDALKLNNNYAEAYAYRGFANLNLKKFDEAINDFSKAIELEPLYGEAYCNRAYACIGKYDSKGSSKLAGAEGGAPLADKTIIPAQELEKICYDLKIGYLLRINTPMLINAITRYCN